MKCPRSKPSLEITGKQGLATIDTITTLDATPKVAYKLPSWSKRLPCIAQDRLSRALSPITSSGVPTPDISLPAEKKPKTVLYLAYGSNLCAETFQGKRGIRPLAAVNVVVPSLTMTFDLPGVPYAEPCFANTRYRDDELSKPTTLSSASPLLHEHPSIPSSLSRKPRYHKDRWPYGLVGVVYEVTPTDYAHIIATEGGGASYQDITVACHPLPEGSKQVPEIPTTTPFLAHTLFAPTNVSEEAGTDDSKRADIRAGLTRPDPSYAQPSARYLKLITSGAAEHSFPPDYTAYLHSLRPYTITSRKQQLGQFIFLSIWFPIIMFLFGLAKVYGEGRGGKSPKWLVWLTGKVFVGMWTFYDVRFRGIFGDGERTVKAGDVDGEDEWDGWDGEGLLAVDLDEKSTLV
ncbi:hypothetical protein MMC19_002754 [Ptychographa xylographoides]|nr:hypothetical protein [Ptychographa xylographoides]